MTARTPAPAVRDLGTDGERTHRASMADRDRRRLQRLLAAPWWATAALELAWWTVIVAAVVLEQPLIASALELIMPSASSLQIDIGAAAYLIVYVTLWHAIGHRLADARDLHLDSTSSGTARRINPAFGALGVTLTLILVAALLGIAVRRALSLGDRAASTAVNNAVAASISAIGPDELDRIRSDAWRHAFVPDLLFTLSVMALLAVLALWIGYSAAPRHLAFSLHLSRLTAHRANDRADRADAEHHAAQRRITLQGDTAADRRAQEPRFHDALDARFARAKSTLRHQLTYGQGRPDATTTLADTGHHTTASTKASTTAPEIQEKP